jgi:phosphatidate cytidylyltransferase
MTRLFSGVVLAGAALAAILLLPITALKVVASAVAILAAHEYARIAVGATGAGGWLLAGAAGLACWWAAGAPPMPLVAAALAAFAVLALAVLWFGWTMPLPVAVLAAPLYAGVPLGLLVAAQAWLGARATLLLLGTVVASDTAQYYSGRRFGRTPLAPAISPKKTVEGAIGGLVVGALVMAGAGRWALPDQGTAALVSLGLVVVALGIAGDLFESRLKRLAGVKDSSSLIPGHGGVLDRIDALLFASPAFYLVVRSGS